jgi:hypothetical protein
MGWSGSETNFEERAKMAGRAGAKRGAAGGTPGGGGRGELGTKTRGRGRI